jgi:hypothetical protein
MSLLLAKKHGRLLHFLSHFKLLMESGELNTRWRAEVLVEKRTSKIRPQKKIAGAEWRF